jgi:hypothetical protein
MTTKQSTSSRRGRLVTAAPIIALVSGLALAGCGDDEGASEKYNEYCANELAVEQAIAVEDMEAMEAAAAALIESAPDDDAREAAQAAIDAAAGLEGPPDAAFNETYGEMIDIIKDNCGYGEVDVEAKEYSFSGIGDEVDAGPTVITFDNEGEEYHELLIMKRVEGDETPVTDLLAMEQDEVMQFVQPAGMAFAGPDTTGYTVVDLEPGKYVVVCFLPEGATQEAFDEMMAGGAEPEGDPHAMHGMTDEFEVTS